ncbi:uncharacterized protein LOC107041581 isoform X1 [Diachasma alloeum]|uniref:uncharacterized protein LOC107041581 isoform X1 n=1 Tax=Diachasma alloeum TaxID=454923 RepID=UPI0007384C56|nr:uncharacterized protein LOC107041581 isoform X1 [Diachasma alloeum]XP_015117671.1 uncharacterized protein LOC107041581 isoform X1 [Diachasma alloeum]
MGQCVSRKAGAVYAASSYRIMDKTTKNKSDQKGSSKRGAPHTRGTAISFGFRRRSRGDAYLANNAPEVSPQRSKSVGPEQVRHRIIDEEDRHTRVQSASSGRSTPRLAPPKKEQASGVAVRTNRFGFRSPQAKFTDKVGDICSGHSGSHFGQGHYTQEKARGSYFNPEKTHGNPKVRPGLSNQGNNPPYHQTVVQESRGRMSSIPEPVSKYTLHTSHLPQPQYAVRVTDSNSKIAKTAANQSRKVSTASKGSGGSQSGSGTEDSGVGSQPGYLVDNCGEFESPGRRGNAARPRNLRMVVSGKSFDVREVEDGSTVTEISVIPLPKGFAGNLGTGIVRERTVQYQRVINKDNRYTESTTSMSTTSSEGYDEGLGEEKVYKDRSRSEKVPSIKSDFSPPSSDDPEYGHGEAMADEYSFSSIDEYRTTQVLRDPLTTSQDAMKTISNAAKSGTLPKNTLRSVLLTIEDTAFAAAAATSTTLIDETSPVDSLVESLTASITQSDNQTSKRERIVEKSGVNEDDSPGTPTNASNSLSLSEGREYFDDEIADQPGLVFDDTRGQGKTVGSAVVESSTKTRITHGKSVENSPINCRRISRTGSVNTLSPCESITSDDLMLDYECSEVSSYDEVNKRLESNPALHELDDATIISELEAQGEQVMREWSSLLGTVEQNSNSNLANNNVSINTNNNYNPATTESGISTARTSRILRSRAGTDSPRSQDSVRTKQIASPFRPVFTGNGQSPSLSLDSGDEGSPRLEKCNYHQDIVSIKTGLLKLMRVVQESGEKDLTRAETLNPFTNPMVNGLFPNLNEDGTTETTGLSNGALNVADEMADLRRQVIFLQGQLEDKDRTIQQLQMQVAKQQEIMNNSDSPSCSSSMNGNSTLSRDICNAATQTEKIRPISAGPSLLQSLPQEGGMGPLVSWSDSWSHQSASQRPPSLVELSSSKAPRKITERPSKILKPKQEITSRLNGDVKVENTKSCIPSFKKFPTTFIPRANGRLHNS